MFNDFNGYVFSGYVNDVNDVNVFVNDVTGYLNDVNGFVSDVSMVNLDSNCFKHH
jgi:hypothetical protein